MKIYITGLPSGYEVEHLARLFYPMAPLTLTPPEPAEDCLWAEKTDTGLRVLVRQGEKSKTLEAPLPLPVEQGGETPEFALASLTYDLLRSWTGVRPPWGKMTGVRPVRLIHDKRAAGWSAEQIDRFFLQRFDCSEQKYEMAKEIADLQEPILQLGSAPKTYSLYIGIPFCPSRCSYCSFVSCNLDRDRKLVQPYVDCLCKEVAEIRVQAERAGLTLCSIYIGGGTPTSLSAAQLRQLMGTVRENFDLSKVVEYTVEAGRPDCTDAEKLAVIKEYGATRISINPQTFSDAVLANIGRKHSAQDILDCYADARRAGHEDINMDLIAGLPGDTVEGFEHSLRQAIALQPENITVHTLTLKRASRIVIEDQKENDYADVAAMLEKCHLLAEAGYPNGFDMSIAVISSYQPHMDTAEVVVEQLRAIGVNAEVVPMDEATWADQVYKNRQFQATINGETMTFTRSSNTFEADGMNITFSGTFNAADGVGKDPITSEELKNKKPEDLFKTDGEGVTFTSKTNADTIVDAIKSMVEDYNAIVSEVKKAYSDMPLEQSDGSKYKPLTDKDKEGMTESEIKAYEEKAKTGILFMDRDLSSLYNALRSAVAPGGADGSFLRSIGIKTSYEDGLTTISLDETALREALETNPDQVRDAFTKSKDNGAATDGLMTMIQKVTDRYAATTGDVKGILIEKAGSQYSPTAALDNTLLNQMKEIDEQIEKWQDKMSNKVDYYTNKFTQLEVLIQQMNSQSSTLSGLMGGY